MGARMVSHVHVVVDRNRQLFHRLQSGAIWTISTRTAAVIMVFLIHVLLARRMAVDQFAAFVIGSSVTIFFSMAAMLGLNTLVCRHIAASIGMQDHERARQAVYIVIRLGGWSIGGTALAGWVAIRVFASTWFDLPPLIHSAAYIGIWIALLAANQITAEIFRGLHRLFAASILGGVSGGLVSSTLLFVGLVMMNALRPLVLRDVILLAIVAQLLPLIVSTACLYRIWPFPKTDLKAGKVNGERRLPTLTTRGVLREALPLMCIQWCSFGLAQIDIWMVGAYCSETNLAVYAVARRMSLLVAMPLTQIGLVVSSSISELHAQDDRHRMQWILRAAATVSALMTSVVFTVLTVWPSHVLGLTFGTEFRDGAATLWVLCLGQLAFALTGPCGPALMMTGHQRILLGTIVASMAIFLLGPWAATTFGLLGIAVVSASFVAVNNLLQWIAAGWVLGMGTHPICKRKHFTKLFDTMRSRTDVTTSEMVPIQSQPQ